MGKSELTVGFLAREEGGPSELSGLGLSDISCHSDDGDVEPREAPDLSLNTLARIWFRGIHLTERSDLRFAEVLEYKDSSQMQLERRQLWY